LHIFYAVAAPRVAQNQAIWTHYQKGVKGKGEGGKELKLKKILPILNAYMSLLVICC